MFVCHAQGPAECAADRDAAAGLLGWGPGVWGLCGLGCSWESLSPAEPWGKAQRERMFPGADSGKRATLVSQLVGTYTHPSPPTDKHTKLVICLPNSHVTTVKWISEGWKVFSDSLHSMRTLTCAWHQRPRPGWRQSGKQCWVLDSGRDGSLWRTPPSGCGSLQPPDNHKKTLFSPKAGDPKSGAQAEFQASLTPGLPSLCLSLYVLD